MPVQLTLRSPKGGRVLYEREYADGHRIDATSGWLVVVDRNGSTVAAHAACPGLEGAIVEHTSAAAAPGPFLDGGTLVDDSRDSDDDEDRFAEGLMRDLRRLGDEYGPLGVAIAAATLTDPQVLVRQVVDDPSPARQEPADGSEENLDALRAEVACLSGLLDDAFREANERAYEAVAELEALRRTLGRTQVERNEANERAYAAEQRLASMTGKRDRAREHAVRNDGERDAETERADRAVAEAVAATQRAERASREARTCREEQAELRDALGREQAGRRHAESLVASYRRQLGEVEEQRDRANANLVGEAHVHVTPDADADTLGGSTVRAIHLAERRHPHVIDDPVPHEPIDLRPVEEDPRRPSLNAWPDDAVLLTYREIRRLLALHVEACDPQRARGLLDGEVPIRVSEVVDR